MGCVDILVVDDSELERTETFVARLLVITDDEDAHQFSAPITITDNDG